jgi:penicillin-binding protein 1A
MKRIWKGLGTLAFIAVTAVAAAAGWLYFYTADLPPTSQLQEFNPATESEALVRFCDGTEAVAHVVPSDKLGHYLLRAVTVAEGQPDPRSPFYAVIRDFPRQRQYGRYSWQIARTLVCEKRSQYGRVLEELRVANAIERKFEKPEILTIYLNRVYLGAGTYGVEAGANRYFGKPASNLSLEQAALLVSLIRAPSRYSPTAHRDRALQRRNSVLDGMVNQGSVSRADADRAKAAGLSLRRDIQ